MGRFPISNHDCESPVERAQFECYGSLIFDSYFKKFVSRISEDIKFLDLSKGLRH